MCRVRCRVAATAALLLVGPACTGLLSGGGLGSDTGCSACDRGAVDRDKRPDVPRPGHDLTPVDHASPSPDMPSFKPGQPKRITNHSASDQNPLWSPDGKRIAFSTQRAHSNFDLWIMNADGSSPKALTSYPDNDAVDLPGSSWCKSTDRIVFASDVGGPENIWTIKSDGTAAKQVSNTQYLDQEPTWSPTCDRIVFQSQRNNNWDIYVMKADGTGVTRLTTHGADDWAPNWSPVSETIVFQSKRTGNWKLWTVQATGGPAVQLTTGNTEDTDCSWSPDGKYVVYSTDAGGTGGAQIGVIPLASPANLLLVTSGNFYDGAPCWSPLGRTIAFESRRSGNLDIWTVDLW